MLPLQKRKFQLLVVEKLSAHDLAYENGNTDMLALIKRRDPSIKALLLGHEEHTYSTNKLAEFLNSPEVSKVCSWTRVYRDGLTADHVRAADVLITLGGDGTFLWASKFIGIGTCQIIGINSSPSTSVGYYTMGDISLFCQRFLWLLEERWVDDVSLTRLEYTINGHVPTVSTQRYVMNDVLFCAEHPADMSRYSIKTREGEEEQKSSGVWVCTPAGSTAAMLSAGGVVQGWTDRRLQYKVREPYKAITNPDKSFYRLVHGFINPLLRASDTEEQKDDDSMEIVCKMRRGLLCLDGSTITRPVTYGDKIIIKPSRHSLRVLGKTEYDK